MGVQPALEAHLKSGLTTVARCWGIERTDGRRFGFTDHDLDLSFDGHVFKAQTGLTSTALEQSTGLSVDNSEAMGALSDASVSDADIEAGRFDQAQVFCWLVNWSNVSERTLMFRGTIGELRRAGGAFHAELRGLTEALNRPLGRVFQKPCTAVLGDSGCGFDLEAAGYSDLRAVDDVSENRIFRWRNLSGFAPGWFERGRLTVQSGPAKGLRQSIKQDRIDGEIRIIELWEPIRASISSDDQVLLEAGCDKRHTTCRFKFDNILNFQGFPDIPGEDWMMSYPRQAGENSGGSLR